MKAKSPQAHSVSTLKERLSATTKGAQLDGKLRAAQGFATA
jgi:hypothetical protein